jgi:acyl-CoA reductase-like NAD-dependent aldehyde dehydrogenase
VPTGLAVLKGAAESGRVKQVTLELGGKNPFIVYPDADVEVVAEAAVLGMNYTRNQGQSCGSTSRLLVHKDVARSVTEAVIDRVSRIKLGLPEDDSTEMGSLISREHQQRVLTYIAGGQQEGARLCQGGKEPDGPLARGAYVEPTVFDRVKPDMRIAQEEIFGPVLSIIEWDDEAAMLHAVNQVQYGLTAAIYTNDISTAIRCADQVQVGYVWINGVETRWVGMPFGGFKNSGFGTEHSLEELLSYTRLKAVNVMV